MGLGFLGSLGIAKQPDGTDSIVEENPVGRKGHKFFDSGNLGRTGIFMEVVGNIASPVAAGTQVMCSKRRGRMSITGPQR